MGGSRVVSTVAVVLGLVVAAGCGSDDRESSSVTGTTASAAENAAAGVSKEEFIDQANSLCAGRSAEVKVKGRRVFKEVFNEPEAVAAKRMATEVIIPTFEGELRDLKTLNIPPNDGDRLRAIYAALEKMISDLKADPTVNGFYPYTEVEKLAAKYGLTACGHP
jgi:hypothetical protein